MARMRTPLLGVAVLLLVANGCSSSDSATAAPGDDAGLGAADVAADTSPTDAPTDATFGGDRPTQVRIPKGYDAAHPAPLVILLHGYGASGKIQDLYFGLSKIADAHGFVFAAPDGTLDSTGKLFWNATNACCNFGAVPVDDVAYLSGLVRDVKAAYAIDSKRVYFVGHSNGGFMSHRLACDKADQIAAIVSLAGAVWSDASRCTPTEPVSVLQIHGDADAMVAYEGGSIGGDLADGGAAPIGLYPSAAQTVATWATLDGCDAALDAVAPDLDLAPSLAGAETTVARHGNCQPGGAAELWTVRGAGHVPSFAPDFAERVWGFLESHPKP